MYIYFYFRAQDDTRQDRIFQYNQIRFKMCHKCFMCHLENIGVIMMISYGVFQERKTRLTYNVEYGVGLVGISTYGMVCYQHTLVYLATCVMNYYSMPEVLSVTSTMDYME